MVDEFLEKVAGKADVTDNELIAQAEEDVKFHENALAELKIEKDINFRLNSIVVENIKPLEVNHEYQKVDEYWTLQKELTKIAINRSMREFDMRIAQTQKAVDAKKENLRQMKGE